MNFPRPILARLQRGQQVAAEVHSPRDGHRAFIVVIPCVPSPSAQPALWSWAGTGEAWLRDRTAITGYEIRYLQHDTKYTDEAWGWDYDQVLADTTTRVRRQFVAHIEDIANVLAPWLTDFTQFGHPDRCDSSLVTSPIGGYLNRIEQYPHLTQS